jgi:hypothetical protein
MSVQELKRELAPFLNLNGLRYQRFSFISGMRQILNTRPTFNNDWMIKTPHTG